MTDDPCDFWDRAPPAHRPPEQYPEEWQREIYEKPGAFESYWDLLLWPPLWIALLGVTTIGTSIWALVKYL